MIRKSYLKFLPVLAALLLLTACGGDSNTSSAASDNDADDEVSVDDVELDESAVLRFGYQSSIVTLDPHLGTASQELPALYPIYDRLVHQDPSGAPIPGLATSWEFNEDGTALTLNLREGVTFHDGTAFDAEAVKANLERAKTVEGSTVSAVLEDVATIEVVDELTVELGLSSPNAAMPLLLADRAGMMISPAAFESDLQNKGIGAGPFKVVTFRSGDQITYERNEDYWEPEAVKLAGIELSIMTDATTRANAVRSGGLDLTTVDAGSADSLGGGDLTVEDWSGLSFDRMQLNRSFEPFADEQVRQALNHAVNRDAIVETLLFGRGNPSSQPFPEGYLAYSEDVGSDGYEYDVDLAVQLLEDAGYPDGFEFEAVVPVPTYQRLAEVLQSQFADVGITMNLRPLPAGQIGEVFYVNQESHAAVGPWGGRPDPALTLSSLYTCCPLQNPGGHTTEEMEAAVAATYTTLDEGARTDALRDASALVVEQAFDLVLYFPTTAYVHDGSIVGLEKRVSGYPEFRNVGIRAE